MTNNKNIKLGCSELYLLFRYCTDKSRQDVFDFIKTNQPELKASIEALEEPEDPFSNLSPSYKEIENAGLEQKVVLSNMGHFLFAWIDEATEIDFLNSQITCYYLSFVREIMKLDHSMVNHLEDALLKFNDKLALSFDYGCTLRNELVKMYVKNSKEPKFEAIECYLGSINKQIKQLILLKLDDKINGKEFQEKLLSSKIYRSNIHFREWIDVELKDKFNIENKEDFCIESFVFAEKFKINIVELFLNLKKTKTHPFTKLNLEAALKFEDELQEEIFAFLKENCKNKSILLHDRTIFVLSPDGEDFRLSNFFVKISEHKEFLMRTYLASADMKSQASYTLADTIKKIFNYCMAENQIKVKSQNSLVKSHKV